MFKAGNGQSQVLADTADLNDGRTYWDTTGTAFGDSRLYATLGSSDASFADLRESLVAFNVPGLGTDYPHGALFSSAWEPSSRAFQAVGDSFISGEGDKNARFEGDNCHRSTSAWPRLAHNDTALGLTLTGFPACSGATTHDLLYGSDKQPKQISALKPGAKVVAISVGGNDSGFKNMIYACVLIDCNTVKSHTLSLISKLGDKDKLPAVYKAVRSRAGAGAEIYVMGYPYTSQCGVFGGAVRH